MAKPLGASCAARLGCGSVHHPVHEVLSLSRDEYLAIRVRGWETLAIPPSIYSVCDHSEEDLHLPRTSTDPSEQICAFERLARTEMTHHGLLPAWHLVLDRSLARAGACLPTRKILSFSRHLVTKAAPRDWLEVIRHEIAHSLAGVTHGHDLHWRDIAQSIGCTGKRCHSLNLAEPPWVLECIHRCWSRACFRRTLLLRKPLCPACGKPCKYRRSHE